MNLKQRVPVVMTGLLVSNVLWEVINPLLPFERPKLRGGRPRILARATLGGILFILLRHFLADAPARAGVRE